MRTAMLKLLTTNFYLILYYEYLTSMLKNKTDVSISPDVTDLLYKPVNTCEIYVV